MVSWIKSLFCEHEWKHIHSVEEISYDYLIGEKVITGHYDVYVCQKCLKKKKIRY